MQYSTTGSMASSLGAANPFRYRGYYYDTETALYYLQSRYYDPQVGRFINADGKISGVGGEVLGYNMYAYCFNDPINMEDDSGNWPKWLETAAKVVSAVVVVAAVVVMATTVASVATGALVGAAAVKAVTGASIFLGAALSGINGGVANNAKGNSYLNGYVGGAVGGAIQAAASKKPGGTTVGGAAGVVVGTVVTGILDNVDPYSSDSTFSEIASSAAVSGAKALVTSGITEYVGYASDMAVADGAGGLMPQFTYGFGEGVKAFFGWVDDAMVYIWG